MKHRLLVALIFLIPFMAEAQKKESKNEKVEFYSIVETMPIYPGGDKALLEFVGKTVEYPPKAKEAGITGKVFVSYVVSSKGKVTKVKVARGADPMLNKAAVKCIKKLKGYKPGTQKGKPVAVQFTIPINFQLN